MGFLMVLYRNYGVTFKVKGNSVATMYRTILSVTLAGLIPLMCKVSRIQTGSSAGAQLIVFPGSTGTAVTIYWHLDGGFMLLASSFAF
ncbi:hypothetical protein F4774DRAFT_377952 [Daldinia eschscholtzii]|nr:hypothetical protein F4774DRAFT_377952 [Daldinia eschscholtzii]